jgi:hypothetical protein
MHLVPNQVIVFALYKWIHKLKSRYRSIIKIQEPNRNENGVNDAIHLAYCIIQI